MPDSITATLDDTAFMAALVALGPSMQTLVNEAAKESAEAIVKEAQSRLRRQLGPSATGATLAGIESRPAYDGNGYVVLSERDPFPNLPLWLEKGTKKGKKRSHKEPAKPYFYPSAQLEVGAHERRIAIAIQNAIDAQGLGE